MTPKMFLRILVLATAIVLPSVSSSSFFQNPQTDGYRRQTSVTLIPRGPDGQLVSLTRADIYLDVWNGGQLAPLPRNGQAATLRLDQDWLCSAWTELCKNHMEPARIVLQAEGYAPITAIIYWPGQTRPGDRPPVASAGIELSGGRDIRIEEGSTRSIDITFHQASSRLVRIVEENGNPAAGILLDVLLYFAATSHVGGIEGESLASGKTDANGQLTIPDVDGEVAVEFGERNRYVFQSPDRVSRFRKLITPTGTPAVTTLVLHRFLKQSLDIHFVNRNGSASGLILGTCLKFCSGACCGDEATTDATGHVHVEDFYPEEIDSLYLTDKSGSVLWRGNVPRVGISGNAPTITLPATSR